jgi:protease-4
MKKIFKVIWTLIKVCFFTIGCLVVLGVFLLFFASLIAAASSHKKIEDKSILVFNLDTRITDQPTDQSAEALSRLFGNDESVLQLRAATDALRKAASDKHISALYLHGNLETENYASGYAALKELREAIQDFQKSGKPVIAYIDNADNRDYYLQSVADQVLLNPMGILAFRGLAAQGTFFKGAEDKYGIELTAIRHGKFKGAVEPFIRGDFSPENREQISAFIKVIWGDLVNTVAASRKISSGKLQALVDKEGLIDSATAKENGLVTELAYEGQALDKLRQLTGKTAKDKPFPQITMAKYAEDVEQSTHFKHQSKDKIAILYAEGEIIEGDHSEDGQVAGDKFAKMIRELHHRNDVKALVLRVNSPGGSGQASEVMLDELRKFNADKPVIVSMGTVAASGGYYISMGSRRILAEPTTITGSIGVFGLALNVQKFANDHGITFDTVKTGALADLGTISRPMTDEEHARIQDLIEKFYGEFLKRVATDRKMTTNQVDEIAQGRVWAGQDALKLGLVDEIGGLEKAITVAGQQASLGTNYSVIEYPEKKPFFQQLAETLNGNQQPLSKADLPGRVAQKVKSELHTLSGFNDPQGIYARMPMGLELN